MIQGDLNVRRTGAIDGWCWDTERPAARLAVELLVDGAVVATVAADAARNDLQRRGIGDGRHAFHASIGATLLAGGERLVAARDGLSRVVFGQYYVGTPDPPAPNPSLDALEDELREMSAGLGRLVAARSRAPDATGSLRDELGQLGAVLGAAGIHAAEPAGAQLAAMRAVLARQLGPEQPATGEPSVALVLLGAGVSDAMAWLRCLGADGGTHELLLPDLGTSASVSLLPSLAAIRTLPVAQPGLARTMAAAASTARAPVVAAVGSPGSLVALDDLIAQWTARQGRVLLGAAASARARALGVGADWHEQRAVAATGLLFAASPGTVAGELDAAYDGDPALAALDLAMRHPGRCWTTVEPWQPQGAASETGSPADHERFRARWLTR